MPLQSFEMFPCHGSCQSGVNSDNDTLELLHLAHGSPNDASIANGHWLLIES